MGVCQLGRGFAYMIDISVQSIKKAFEEGNDILNDLSFEIREGERVGLLGKNGAGKTTLLKLITGELLPDEGSIAVPEFKKLGLISQIPTFPDGYTADDVLRTAFDRQKKIKDGMEKLEDAMSGGCAGADILKEYDALAFEYERLGGFNMEFELNRVANGLRIPQLQREQPFDSLSGGEKTRINLARLILENTAILLLDEPTNHLDMRATIWLEEFLGKFKGSALIISHDRYFLDRTIHRAVEINAGKAEFYSGNYSFYVREKQRRFDEQLEKYEREQTEAKRLRDAADRLHQWGTGNKNLMKKSFAIEKRAERAVQTGRPVREKTVRAKFAQREFRGDVVLSLGGMTKSYGGRKLFDIDEIEVRGGERIALIGDNGTGKTTLVKIIMGEEKQDAGTVRRGLSVKPAYLPQIVRFEHPRRTILDTLMYERDISTEAARNRLGAFMFSGEDVFKQVGDLSGGEKSRLRLCVLMMGEINLFVLDEPTNHLDLPSREWIEDAVGQYGGTLIFISHDRYFIDRFATRVWELEDGAFTDFTGTYAEFCAYKEQKSSREAAGAGAPGAPAKNAWSGAQTRGRAAAEQESADGSGRAGSGSDVRAGRSHNGTGKKPSDARKEIRRLEREIEKLESELGEVGRRKEEFATDYETLMELDGHERELTGAIDALYEQWGRLSE